MAKLHDFTCYRIGNKKLHQRTGDCKTEISISTEDSSLLACYATLTGKY
jgi:hypothetical protein